MNHEQLMDYDASNYLQVPLHDFKQHKHTHLLFFLKYISKVKGFTSYMTNFQFIVKFKDQSLQT